jgi:PAS fold
MASGSRGARTSGGSTARLTATNTNTATASATATATATATANPTNTSPTTAAATDSVSKAIAQYSIDARLHAVFEQSGESGRSFNYSQTVKAPPSLSVSAEQQITAYLSKIQRGGHIQPFGCTLAVDESSLKVIAYSENASELLDLSPHHSVPTLDRRTDPLTIGESSISLLFSILRCAIL